MIIAHIDLKVGTAEKKFSCNHLCSYFIIILFEFHFFLIGRYIYLEASDYDTGDTAVLTSHAIAAGITACVQFWYHMKGKDVGSLNVLILRNDSRMIMWNLTGQQGPDWLFGQVGYRDIFNSFKV